MKKTFGQKFTEQAAESYKSDIEPRMREFAQEFAQSVMDTFEECSPHGGTTIMDCLLDNPSEFPMAYQFRKEFVHICLEYLPIDIGLKIEAADVMSRKVVLRAEVVELYKGGKVNYDFPVWQPISDFYYLNNLDHLKTLELEGEELLEVEAFEIILAESYMSMEARTRAMEWGMKYPKVIKELTDPTGFFTQFTNEGTEIEIAPYTGEGTAGEGDSDVHE